MSKIAILLNGGIINDSRVIKIIRSFSKNTENLIDLFYEDSTPSDDILFNKNVRLFSISRKINFKTKLIRHTVFYNEFLFLIKPVLATKIKYDYIYANDLPCLKPAVIIKKQIGAKVIYDSHEIYIETINQFFPNNSSGIRKLAFNFLIFLMRKLGVITEKKLLKKVDSFITVGKGLQLYFEKTYKQNNVNVLMNFPNIPKNIVPVNIHSIINLDKNDFIVIYQGVLNLGRGLYTMIETFKYTEANIKLVILGYGTLQKSLQEFVNLNKLSQKVFFHEKVDSSILLNYTKAANCGISLLEPFNLSCKFAAPNKLFEYINAGIPVIASRTLESEIVFSKYNIGELVENNPILIAESINNLAKSDTTIYKENCKKAALEYNWENQEKILLNFIQ